jgi:hypothetical protein
MMPLNPTNDSSGLDLYPILNSLKKSGPIVSIHNSSLPPYLSGCILGVRVAAITFLTEDLNHIVHQPLKLFRF